MYLIADASGHSVIVEYVNQELCVVEAEDEYQIASNFVAYDGLNIGEGFTEFERYDKVQNAIEANNGILEAGQAVQLLADVGIFNEQRVANERKSRTRADSIISEKTKLSGGRKKYNEKLIEM